jgi:hypothetical protein
MNYYYIDLYWFNEIWSLLREKNIKYEFWINWGRYRIEFKNYRIYCIDLIDDYKN